MIDCVDIIEIIDIECVLLSLLCEKIVATKWRIYKGILTSSRLLRERISCGRKECDLFLSTRVYKRHKFETLNEKKGLENVLNKVKKILWENRT